MTVFLVDKQPGFGATAPGVTIPGKIEKMGYRGVETTEMVLDEAGWPSTRSSVARRVAARASTR